jgi:hypothetical protein
MGEKYTSRTQSGYNATPPADDGTETEANKGYWATIKEKLGDPNKNYADDINSAMATFADYGPITKSAAYTTTTADHLKTIEGTGTFILTLGAVATMGAGYIVTIKNVGTGVVTVDGSSTETIDGQLTVTLNPLEGITAQINNAGTSYLTIAQKDPQFPTPAVTTGTASAYTVATGETAYVTNRVYEIQMHTDNDGAATIDFDSIGAKDIKTPLGLDPDPHAIGGGIAHRFLYDGTDMVLQDGRGRVKLDSYEVTGSSAASIIFTDIPDHDNYLVEFENVVPVTDTAAFYFEQGYGGTPTWVVSSYKYHVQRSTDNGATYAADNSTSTTQFLISIDNGTGTNEIINGSMKIHNVQSTSSPKAIESAIIHVDANGNLVHVRGSGESTLAAAVANPITAVRFTMATGDIAIGSIITIYAD